MKCGYWYTHRQLPHLLISSEKKCIAVSVSTLFETTKEDDFRLYYKQELVIEATSMKNNKLEFLA